MIQKQQAYCNHPARHKSICSDKAGKNSLMINSDTRLVNPVWL